MACDNRHAMRFDLSAISRRLGPLARPLGLVAVATPALHELRCLPFLGGSEIGFGWVAALLACLGLILLGVRLWRVRLGRADRVPEASRYSTGYRVVAFALAILALYVCEALLEGALLATGAGGLLGPGGWCVLPLALALAPLCLLADRGFGRLEAAAAVRRPRLRRPAVLSLSRIASAPARSLPSPLASGLARRPPPLSLG